MRGVKRCQESTGRMKKHRYGNEFKVTAVKMANAPDIETKAVAEALKRPTVYSEITHSPSPKNYPRLCREEP
jgi:hypothetical protein